MTDFRALCAELFEIVEDEYSGTFCLMELRSRARTDLAQPEPQEPTDDELQKAADAMRDEDDTLSLVEYARTVLSRWSRPAKPEPEAHNG